MQDHRIPRPARDCAVRPFRSDVSAALARRRRADDRGMTTAEYAVGTIAAVTFAGVLIKVLSDPSIRSLLLNLIVSLIRQFQP